MIKFNPFSRITRFNIYLNLIVKYLDVYLLKIQYCL